MKLRKPARITITTLAHNQSDHLFSSWEVFSLVESTVLIAPWSVTIDQWCRACSYHRKEPGFNWTWERQLEHQQVFWPKSLGAMLGLMSNLLHSNRHESFDTPAAAPNMFSAEKYTHRLWISNASRICDLETNVRKVLSNIKENVMERLSWVFPFPVHLQRAGKLVPRNCNWSDHALRIVIWDPRNGAVCPRGLVTEKPEGKIKARLKISRLKVELFQGKTKLIFSLWNNRKKDWYSVFLWAYRASWILTYSWYPST